VGFWPRWSRTVGISVCMWVIFSVGVDPVVRQFGVVKVMTFEYVDFASPTAEIWL
jgi:hypothetical protein